MDWKWPNTDGDAPAEWTVVGAGAVPPEEIGDLITQAAIGTGSDGVEKILAMNEAATKVSIYDILKDVSPTGQIADIQFSE